MTVNLATVFHPNKDESRRRFPQLFKNGTTNGNRERARKGEGKGGRITFHLRIDLLGSMGNFMPELTLAHFIVALVPKKVKYGKC